MSISLDLKITSLSISSMLIELRKDLIDAGFGLRTIVSRFDGCFGFSVYMPQAAPQPVKVEE